MTGFGWLKRGRNGGAPHVIHPEPDRRVLEEDSQTISTTGLTFKLKFLGMEVVGGPECEFWQGAAASALSAIAKKHEKRKQRYLLTVSPTRIHLARKKPAPWVLLHDHPLQVIDYWFYDFTDPNLFGYCVRAEEAGFYNVYCFKMTNKKQSGKRLNHAFYHASILWQALSHQQRREELRLKNFLQRQKEAKKRREEEEKQNEEERRKCEETQDQTKKEIGERKILRVLTLNLKDPNLRTKEEMFGPVPQTLSELVYRRQRNYTNNDLVLLSKWVVRDGDHLTIVQQLQERKYLQQSINPAICVDKNNRFKHFAK